MFNNNNFNYIDVTSIICAKNCAIKFKIRERGFTIRVEIFLSVEQADAARCCHLRSS